MDSDASNSNKVFSFVEDIQNSVMSNSKKLSDSIKGSDSNSSEDPLLLTTNIKYPVNKSILDNSRSKASNDPLVKGEPLTIDGSVKSRDSASKSWLNIGKTTRIWLKVIVVIVLLGIVGINVFIYLGFSFKTLYGLLDKFVNYIKSLLTGKKSKSKSKSNPKPKPKSKQDSSNNSLDKNMKDLADDIEKPTPVKKETIKPDDDVSTIHTSGKSGYCNVGSWKGIRSCVKVSSANECISGDIFPTKDICVNPNLRN
jgi:hypothetical protein